MSNYNIDPYFDDFDKTKNYVKVLFKPGVPVQARELTQMQTAIQEQIKSIGGFLFKNESLVLGGESSSFDLFYIDVISTDLTSYVGREMIAGTSGSRIRVISYKNNIASSTSRLYFSYLNGKRIQISETLTENVFAPEVSQLTVTNDTGNTGSAKAFKLHESVFYVKDYFVVAEEQTIILDDSLYPTVKVGLKVTEQVVNYQDDETLLDPASGSYNYAAPGADRVQISLNLSTVSYDPVAESDATNMADDTTDNFIEIARYKEGVLIKSLKNPSLGALEGVLAKRTYDESGDYTVKAFKAKVVDNVKKNKDLLSVYIEPGKAYVKGYEFETTSPVTLDLDKSRTYSTTQNTINEAGYGDYFLVTTPVGGSSAWAIDYSANPEISLRNSSNTVIGTANISFVKRVSSTKMKIYVTRVSVNSSYSINSINNLYKSPWTAVVDTTGVDSNGNNIYLYRGKYQDLIIPLNDSPIKALQDLSYITQIKTTGVASSSSLSPSLSISSGKSYVSSDVNDYVVVSTSDGSSPTITSVSVSGVSFTISGTFVNGTTYNIFAKVAVNSPVVKYKTKTTTTVYLNNSSADSITLGVSDVFKIKSIYAANYDGSGNLLKEKVDLTNVYYLDNGQRSEYYENASINLKPGQLPVSDDSTIGYNVLEATIEYFVPSQDNGYFSVDSYDVNSTDDDVRVDYSDIPSMTLSSGKVVSLRDIIDFRPRRDKISGFPGSNTARIGTTLNTSFLGSEMCEPLNYVTCDYEYYLSRTDKLIITKEKKFDLIKGIPNKSPGVPTDSSDAMTIYVINVPAYTFSAESVKVSYIENKRYTMRDIGKIDKRVSRLEYYTAMTLLEKQASDELIVNSTGLDKFKNGILVDPFAGHGVGDVGAAEYSCSIDSLQRVLRPRFAKQNIEFDINREETSSSDYSLREKLVTLPYTDEVLISNSQATGSTNIQRYSTFIWGGEVTLNPSSDTWSESTTLPDLVVNINGDNDAFTTIADTVSNPASTGLKWADWQLVDKGVDVSSTSSSVDDVTYYSQNSRAIQNTETTTTTQTTTVVTDTYNRSGIEIDASSVSVLTRDLGTKVVDASLVPYIRSRVVDFSACKLQPNVELFASFDGINVTEYCVQAPTIYVSTVDGATRVRKIGTSVAADVLLLRSNKAIIKMDADQYLFNVGDIVEWYVDGSWIAGSGISSVFFPTNSSLYTDDAGDIAGYFYIPNNSNNKFTVGEKVFRLADTLSLNAKTAAESKYVALGLAMSLQKDVISTRVQTVSINPVSASTQTSSTTVDTTVEVSNVTKDVTVYCGDTASGSGNNGRFVYEIDFGTDIGQCGVNYDPSGIPDRYTIVWNGREYTTGFRNNDTGSTNNSYYNELLNSLGYPSITSEIDSNNTEAGKLRFEKTSIFPNKATLIVDAPLSGTTWSWKIVCPGKTDNLLPETSPSLTMTVDTPNAISVAFTSTDGVISADNNSVSYNFTVLVNGNQNVPSGTAVNITSISRTETTNGRYSSFVSGTTFRRNGNVVSLPLTVKTGETVTFNATYDLSTTARSSATNNNGSISDPRCTIQVSAELVTAIDGYNGAVTSRDTTIIGSTITTVSTSSGDSDFGCGDDPLAQTFYISSRENPDGIFVDSIDLFFSEKDSNEDSPVTVQIRPTVNGVPSSKEIIPLASVTKLSRDINVDNKEATNFRFPAPIYLATDTEYAVIVGAPTTGFSVYISEIGQFLLDNDTARCTKQPLSGVLFYSSNGSTWTADQTQDLCFRLRKCVFPIDTTKNVILNSSLLPSQSYSSVINYDLFFADGEILDFASTNVDYYYKSAKISGSAFAKDNNWNLYQLGSNVELLERKSLDPTDTTTLRMLCSITTTNRDVSPVIDLSRLSSCLVKNVINNNYNSETESVTSTISTITATASEATVTTSSAHNLSVGDVVLVSASKSNVLNGLQVVTIVDSSTVFRFNRVDVGAVSISATPQSGSVTRNAQAFSRYITRKVTLDSNFLSSDLKLYFYAKIPTECQVIPYYRVTSLSDPILEDNAWVQMSVESVGSPSSAGFVEYKYKTPYTVGSDSFALSTGEQYNMFSVKLVMLSSDTTKIPLVRDLRVLALDA